MADLNPTSIQQLGLEPLVMLPAGETIGLANAVYLDTNGKLKLSNHAGTSTVAVVDYITLHSAVLDEPVACIPAGRTIKMAGVTLGVGTIYVLSNTGGKIAPAADLGSSDFVTIIGVGLTTSTMKLALFVSGAETP